MISKNLYIQIIIRVLLLLFFSLLLGWSVFNKQWFVFSTIPALLCVATTINLVRFLNTTNRHLFYFFDAIKNEDSTLSFPENTSNKTLLELNKSLEQVNRQIQHIHIENQQQEQYFQALLEHAATGIMTIDEAGFVLHSNSSLKKLFSVDVLTHLNQLERIGHKLYQTIKNIQPHERRLITLNSETGTIQLSVKASSFISDKQELLLLSVQDIKNELDENELDSWLKLIRVLMHEIMNSIAPITSLSESLAGYFYDDGNVKSPGAINEKIIETTIRGLDVIKEQGKGLMSFVESYRKLTRLPRPEKRPFPAKNIIAQVQVLSGLFEHTENIPVDVQINPEELEILGDEKMISQVLINLVKNALQANAQNINAQVQITAGLNEKGRPEICVGDNGPGISPDIIDEIFVPFFTTKENGSGIGLSVSRQIMRLHGGSLKVSSVPNKETRFTMQF